MVKISLAMTAELARPDPDEGVQPAHTSTEYQTVNREAQGFDATIDLPIEMVPDHLTPREAVSLVRRAVGAMPGANWISVDYAGDVSTAIPWLTLYEPDTAALLNADDAPRVARLVQSIVERALS